MNNFAQAVEELRASVARKGRGASGEAVTPEAAHTYSLNEAEFHRIIDQWFEGAGPTVTYNVDYLRDWLVRLCLDVQSQTEERTIGNMLRSNPN